MSAKLTPTPPPCERGDEVLVSEQGITPWSGYATAVKWSPVSGWWIEVRASDGTYVIRAADVEVVAA